MTWHSDVVPPRSGRAWRLAAGQRLRIVDAEGGQTGDCFAVAADDLGDGLSNGRTFDMNSSIRLAVGSVLYSRSCRPLLRIVEDEVGAHDMLYAPCSQRMYELQNGVTEPHPNCYDNLVTPLAAFGVPESTVTVALNFFMTVVIGPDGGLRITRPTSKAGQGTTFTAERDLLVAVTSCPAASASTDGGRPIRVEIS